ncbi:S1C family serine protease [Allostreptomyces psammosilenae]|uniref:S1-C subfamily serine protease n=1 Tax=Allostreptomyces psammosilenae TaxID=1892865 RepID=A0A852ZPK0_9ACTN|nr:trypsin-like peptidase domain-containing protein [Allostreptomyces psammosilenae]NYI03190.1 S1-C subfamily serine protease [Allostreptomyces psammosilenae]
MTEHLNAHRTDTGSDTIARTGAAAPGHPAEETPVATGPAAAATTTAYPVHAARAAREAVAALTASPLAPSAARPAPPAAVMAAADATAAAPAAAGWSAWSEPARAGHGASGTDQARPAGPAVPPMPPHPPIDGAGPRQPADGAPRAGRRRPGALVAAAVAASLLAGGAAGGIAAHALNDSGGTTVASGPVAATTTSDGGSLDIAAVAAAVMPSTVEINVTSTAGTSTGSGVILTEDGEIVTNAHVVSDAASGGGEITVTLSDGSTHPATLIGSDADSDLALIKAEDASGLTPATLGDSDSVQVGDEVVAIGSPEGLTGTVTSGIVSALGREVTVPTTEEQQQSGSGEGQWYYGVPEQGFPGAQGLQGYGQQETGTTTYEAIQTDASINPGNSGGPLADSAGRIIGLNSAMYSPTDATGSDSGSVGLGFAIPINTVKQVVEQLREQA